MERVMSDCDADCRKSQPVGQCGDTDVPSGLAAPSSKERQCQSHTGKPIFAGVPLVLTFVKEPAATAYECQNRDTSANPSFASMPRGPATGPSAQRPRWLPDHRRECGSGSSSCSTHRP